MDISALETLNSPPLHSQPRSSTQEKQREQLILSQGGGIFTHHLWSFPWLSEANKLSLHIHQCLWKLGDAL